MAQGREAQLLGLVDVGTELLKHALDNIKTLVLDCDIQGRASLAAGEVDGSAELQDQAAHDSKVTMRSGQEQGRLAVMIYLVYVGAELIY
jgi:hypothetical protein